MRQLRCVLIGAGALGNEVARLLGLLGPLSVTIVDPDVVESSNLPRSQFFWTGSSIGRNKAEALAGAAAERFPQTQWSAIADEIADVGFERLSKASLLFSCVDSDLARLEIANISGKLCIPVADAGLGRLNHSRGRVSYFPGSSDGACFSCMLPPRKRRELLELWHATIHPCGGSESTEEDFGSTPTMAAVIGAVQVEFGLRQYFQGLKRITVPARTLELKLSPEPRMDEFVTPVNLGCPFHNAGERSLRALSDANITIEQFLSENDASALVLDWPICVEAKCIACSTKWKPMTRLAPFRRRGVCPSCGTARILELEVIRSIERGSAWAGFSAASLNLPVEHLHTVDCPPHLP